MVKQQETMVNIKGSGVLVMIIYLYMFLTIFTSHGFSLVIHNQSYSSLLDVPATDIIKEVEVLDLSNNLIPSIETQDLSYKFLVIVNLQRNKIQYFDPAAFTYLQSASPVEELVLANNQLPGIPDLQSIGSTLKLLDLSHNQITSIPSSVLNGLTTLKTLYLTNNSISWRYSVPGLENVGPSLMFLDLKQATDGKQRSDLTFLQTYKQLRILNIENIVVYDFPISGGHAICNSLLNLDARLNWLDETDTASFDCFTQLEVLLLYYNEFNTFPEYSSNLRSTLKILDIGLQYMTHIPSSSLQGMFALEQFSANKNRLANFPVFPHIMDNLTYIDLSENKIVDITLDLFTPLPNLERLNISNNHITMIPDITEHYIDRSIPLIIFADYNTFICDCQFKFTLSATDAHKLVMSIRIIISERPCASPQEYYLVSYWNIPLYALCGGESKSLSFVSS